MEYTFGVGVLAFIAIVIMLKIRGRKLPENFLEASVQRQKAIDKYKESQNG